MNVAKTKRNLIKESRITAFLKERNQGCGIINNHMLTFFTSSKEYFPDYEFACILSMVLIVKLNCTRWVFISYRSEGCKRRDLICW